MSTKLFVGGLPWAMDNERLKQVFAEFGDVADARVILDRETGRSRGFGFVTYADDDGAEKALQLDGTEIDGRRIRVDRAQEKERPARPVGRPRPEGGSGPGGRPGGARDFGGGGGDRPGPGAAPPPREREAGAAPPGARPPRGAGPGRDGPGAGSGRRDFGGDDWGGGERDRGERGRRGAAKDKGKGRGRRRGGRGGRGGGEDHDDVLPTSGGIDDFEDWD